MSKHTPGPWAWFGNASSNSLYLATTHSGRRYVMGFKRWGMRGAQPQFQPGKNGLVDASELLQFAVGDKSVRGVEQAKSDSSVYRYDISGIDCADARLISAAPDLLEALQAVRSQFVQAFVAHGVRLSAEQMEAEKLAVAAISKAEGNQP